VNIFEIILIAIGLAMDAFAASVCKGLSIKKMQWVKASIIALYFGGFQALMPLIGFILGTSFQNMVNNISHWIAFTFLTFIGGNMIKDSFRDEPQMQSDNIDIRTMLLLAIATSLDALAVGVTFAFLRINILLAIFIIGIITFFISLIGVKIGNQFGDKFQSKAELTGGIILILIGLKVLLEYLL